MKYAYQDCYGILHIVDSLSVIDKDTLSVKTDFNEDGGFPVIDGKKVYMYSMNEVYLGGNRNSFKAGAAKQIDINDYKELKELYMATTK